MYEGRAFGAVLGGGRNCKSIFEKTRVGFGRTELSLRLSWTEFCALSSRHGPRWKGFQGGSSRVDFHVFQVVQKSAKQIVNTSQKKVPLTIGQLFLDDFKRCQNSAKKIVYTSQKKYPPDHRIMVFEWFLEVPKIREKNSLNFSDFFLKMLHGFHVKNPKN